MLGAIFKHTLRSSDPTKKISDTFFLVIVDESVTTHVFRTAGAVSLGFVGLKRRLGSAGAEMLEAALDPAGLGPRVIDPRGVLNLPAGFAYHVFSEVGQRMDDGLVVPAHHDGMGAFAGPNGKAIACCT